MGFFLFSQSYVDFCLQEDRIGIHFCSSHMLQLKTLHIIYKAHTRKLCKGVGREEGRPVSDVKAHGTTWW